jgi:PAS domain S-box-containing protein
MNSFTGTTIHFGGLPSRAGSGNLIPRKTVPEEYSNLTRHELVRRLQELEMAASRSSETAANDTAERLRAVVSTAVEAIITIDERGIIESFNVAAEKMFGYSAAEIIGRNVKALMPSPYHEHHDEYVGHYCQTGEARIIGIGREVVGRRKDGTVFPMDLSVGEVNLSSGRMFTGIARDITARKRVEAALKREHLFTTTILETAGALVVVLDRQGRIVRLNRACEQATGYSLAEVEGDDFVRRFTFSEDGTAARQELEALRDGEGPRQHENFIRTRDGQRRRVVWSNNVLLDENGEVEFVIGTGLDVTERRQLELEILEISDSEQRRIGRDLHDGLGQHLTALELLNQTLVGKLRKEAPALAEPAAGISRQIREIIRQTRLLSHNLSPVPLEADGLMIALGELAAGTAAMSGVSCDFVCTQHVLLPDADASTHLYRIAQEAVNNALKHAQAKQIHIALAEQTRSWEMRIEDNGRGIIAAEEKKPGLGLRMMRYRAELIGAALEIDSRPRKGTRVVCILPRKA